MCRAAQLESIRQMSRQVSLGSTGEYQADEQAGVAPLSWRFSGLCAGRCCGAQLESNKQRSRQVSRGSPGEYQADEQAGVARPLEREMATQSSILAWNISGTEEPGGVTKSWTQLSD